MVLPRVGCTFMSYFLRKKIKVETNRMCQGDMNKTNKTGWRSLTVFQDGQHESFSQLTLKVWLDRKLEGSTELFRHHFIVKQQKNLLQSKIFLTIFKLNLQTPGLFSFPLMPKSFFRADSVSEVFNNTRYISIFKYIIGITDHLETPGNYNYGCKCKHGHKVQITRAKQNKITPSINHHDNSVLPCWGRFLRASCYAELLLKM